MRNLNFVLAKTIIIAAFVGFWSDRMRYAAVDSRIDLGARTGISILIQISDRERSCRQSVGSPQALRMRVSRSRDQRVTRLK